MTKNQGHDSAINREIRVINGGCHCGAVKFTARVAAASTILACNCSICRMTGFQHLIVGHEDFELLTNPDQLSHYQFNTRQADHLFCRHCGIKSFYQPRSHPDSWSINAHCIQDYDPKDWQHDEFDGKNWLQAKSQLNSE